jgi:hypothetical protein
VTIETATQGDFFAARDAANHFRGKQPEDMDMISKPIELAEI